MSKIIYSIGHSNRSIKEFLNLIKTFNINVVVDVRRFPKSRKFPHFNQENLCKYLKNINVKYYWLGKELGGFRGGYEKYMETNSWKKGFDKLLEIVSVEGNIVAIMCSEKFWFKCHRRFISNKLVKHGFKVIHIISENKVYEHKI